MSRWHFWSKLLSHRVSQRLPRRLRLIKRQRRRVLFAEPLELRLCLSAVSNYVWVANQYETTITKIDKTTNAVAAVISSGVPAQPFGLAVDEDSAWVGGVAPGAGHIARIDKASDTVVETIPLPADAFGVAVDASSVWVTSETAGTVVEIDKTTSAIVATTPLGASAYGVAVDRDFVWVASAGQLDKIDKDTNLVVTSVPIGPSPRGVALDDDSVWVADFGSSRALRINKATNAVTEIPTSNNQRPHGIAVDTDFVWVGNYDEGTLDKIDKTTNSVVATVTLGPRVHGVALDATSVWTDALEQEHAYRIDKQTNQVVTSVPVPRPSTFGDFTGFAFDRTFIVTVAVNIQPNSVNVDSNGTLTVIIYGGLDFDASQIDVGSVQFAGATAWQSTLVDSNNDGLLDLQLKFRTQDTTLEQIYAQLLADDFDADGVLDSTRQTAEIAVTGQTLDDELFCGSDSINLFLAGRSLRELLDSLFE